jgi:hypothetical protein
VGASSSAFTEVDGELSSPATGDLARHSTDQTDLAQVEYSPCGKPVYRYPIPISIDMRSIPALEAVTWCRERESQGPEMLTTDRSVTIRNHQTPSCLPRAMEISKIDVPALLFSRLKQIHNGPKLISLACVGRDKIGRLYC